MPGNLPQKQDQPANLPEKSEDKQGKSQSFLLPGPFMHAGPEGMAQI